MYLLLLVIFLTFFSRLFYSKNMVTYMYIIYNIKYVNGLFMLSVRLLVNNQL